MRRQISRSRGVALFMSLVMLLVLTIVGVSAVLSTSLEEVMARNSHDGQLAFQAAEAALREAEIWVANNVVTTTVFTADGGGGLYTAAQFDEPQRWLEAGVWDAGASREAAVNVPGVAAQPRFIVEWLATVRREENPVTLSSTYATLFDRVEMFRITVRGVGGTEDAAVTLQSTFGKVL